MAIVVNSQDALSTSVKGAHRFFVLLPAFAWLALLAAFAFAIRSIVARGGASHLSMPHVVMLQSAISLPLLMTLARYQNVSLKPQVTSKTFYSWRIFVSLVYGVTLLYSMKLMPAALASALSYTAPLFTALLAPSLLKEKTTPAIIGMTVIGFFGIGLTAEPYLDNVSMLFIGIGLLCGLSGALLQLAIRKLASAGEPGIRGVFWMHVAALILGAAACLASENYTFTMDEFVVCSLLAVAAIVGQLSNSSAYAKGRALPVNAMSFLTLPLTVVMAVLILGESVSSLAIAGLLVTLPACFGLVWLEQAHLRAIHDEKAALTVEDVREEHAQVQSALGVGLEPLYVTEPVDTELERERVLAGFKERDDTFEELSLDEARVTA